MDIERILMWVVCLLMLIGWGIMAAADCLPEYWPQLTIAVTAAMYGIQPLLNAGGRFINQLKK